jgi:hypothetical protein
MPTDTVTAIADQVLEGVSVAQGAVLAVVDTITEALKPLTDALPESPLADVTPDPKAAVEAAFDFAEKVLANQKAFAIKLVEAYAPSAS